MDRIIAFILMSLFAMYTFSAMSPSLDNTDDMLFAASDSYKSSTSLDRVYNNMSKGINELRGDQVKALFKYYSGTAVVLKVSGVTKTYDTLIASDIDVTKLYTVTVTRDASNIITQLNFVVKP